MWPLGSSATTSFPHPPPLSRPRYDIFSGAVRIKRLCGALNIFHTGGSVVGVGVVILGSRGGLKAKQ